jgi:drug/metabolite transporter (DMT)-like permease
MISAASNRSMAPYLWMVAGCFLTAWMSQLAHLLGDGCDWRIIALARSGLAFVFAFGLARLSGATLVFWGQPSLWLRSCASSVSLLCMFAALAGEFRLPTSEVLTLTNTFPIWVALLSWPLLRLRPSLSVWLAAVCGVCGVALIQSPHFNGAVGGTPAVVLSLVAALTSAIAMLGLHRVKGIHPWAIVTHYSGVATLFVLATWAVGPLPDLAPAAGTNTLLVLLGMGVAATLGQVCITRAFTTGQPARVSVVGLTQILFALGLDLLFRGPRFEASTLAGIALVLAPTAWMMAGRAARDSSLPAEQGGFQPEIAGIGSSSSPLLRRNRHVEPIPGPRPGLAP